MFMFECLGSYIRDFSREDHGDARMVCEISEEQAVRLLGNSPWVKRGRPDARVPFLNKGFAVVGARGDRALLVYQGDATYYLYTANKAFFFTKYELSDNPDASKE